MKSGLARMVSGDHPCANETVHTLRPAGMGVGLSKAGMSIPNKQEALNRAREVLEGLSVGDAIGEALSYRFYECRKRADFSALST